MAGITWLHLSDWHQGSENFDEYQKSEAFDREFLSKRLKQDILNRARISADLAKVDFFVFSGDVAFSGQKAEYQAAIEQLFAPALEATGLDKSRLFIVPGNHDLDRKKFRYLPVELTRPFNREPEVKQWLKDSDREFVLKPFEDYDQFINTYTGQHRPTYASILHLDVDGKKVALLGLNSALMCGRNKIRRDEKEEVDDYGKLVVGEPQLVDGLEQIGEADVRIAVIHHPFEWLMPFERMRIKEQLGQNFHFILRGHEHIPEVNMMQGTAGHCLIIPAGSGFDRRMSEDPDYTNAYNFVHLNFDTGQATVYLRRWNNRRSEWDRDTYVYDNGQISFDLPQLRSHPVLDGEDYRGSPDPAPNTATTKVQMLPQVNSSTVHPPVSPPPAPGPSLQQGSLDDNEKQSQSPRPAQYVGAGSTASIHSPAGSLAKPANTFKNVSRGTKTQLDSQERKALRNALLNAYPDQGDFEIVIQDTFNEPLNAYVDVHQNYEKILFDLIGKMESRGKTRELIEAACDSNPGNEMLNNFYSTYIQNRAAQTNETTSADTPTFPLANRPAPQVPREDNNFNNSGYTGSVPLANPPSSPYPAPDPLAQTDPPATGPLSPVEQARADVKEAQSLVEKADKLLPKGIKAASENIRSARSHLTDARKLIYELDALLNTDTGSSLPEPLASNKGRITGWIKSVVYVQIGQLLESLNKGMYGDSRSLRGALTEIQNLIFE